MPPICSQPPSLRFLVASLVIVSGVGCGGVEPVALRTEPLPIASAAPLPLPPVETPLGKLPTTVTPLAYRLELALIPDRERFAGVVEIDLQIDEPAQRIFLHAQALQVASVELRSADGVSVAAAFQSIESTGVASIDLQTPIGPGRYTTRITYDAPYDRQLKGIYRVSAGGQDYAFTQFEAISARQAFPCFDEPRFKTPFDVELTVRENDRAIANTQELSSELLPQGLRKVRFATSEPLPTYLVAFAVGPLDVIEAPPLAPNEVRTKPIPFRAIAVAGKGKDLAHAIEHTPPMVAALEAYFGIAYPYDKLDIIAVPDFASGAMENAGAITFREPLLLLDAARATEGQRRSYAYVMAHELAHQWFGNLVTMPWWDDIWLNEAFATWMGHRVVEQLNPEYHADVSLLQSVHHAMAQDSLSSARVIRQPIDTSNDIANAFDSITYSKGGAVLDMFEQYVGRETFRRAIHEYISGHRFGTATTSDLMAALSTAHGTDLRPAFSGFLDQAGVPLLQARLECTPDARRIHFSQSRFLPIGSSSSRDRTWQVPLCVRWGVGDTVEKTCALITEREFDLTLPGTECPDWFMPNADASAYVRVALSTVDLEHLRERGWSRLNAREQLALSDSLSAAFAAGAIDTSALLGAASTLASSSERAVATTAMGWISFAHDHLVEAAVRSKVEAFGRLLYASLGKRVGWKERSGEDGEMRLLRSEVLTFLALEADDQATRREAAKRGRAYVGFGTDGALHMDAVATDLLGLALTVAVQEGDAAYFDHLLRLLGQTEDAVLRDRLLHALGAVRDPVLAERALALSLLPTVRVNEALTTLSVQLHDPDRRDAAWAWLIGHFDAVLGRVGVARGGRMPWLAAAYCSTEAIEPVRALFGPHLDVLQGGPRNLSGSLEAIALCAAKVNAQRASAAEYFAKRPR